MRQSLVVVSLLNLLAVLSLVMGSQNAVAACSYADASLYGGWGWDPVAEASCPPLDACDYSDADIYGGWGWNTGTQMSCPPITPTAGVCIDSDGDGWGWDGVSSCLIDELPQVSDRLIFVDMPGMATAYEYYLTPDGKSSVFYYWGDDLYVGDNGGADVFVMDNTTGDIKLLTVGENGAKANNDSYLNGVSGDGKTALIHSRVTNFSGTSANGTGQPYLLDVTTGTITQVLDSSPWSHVSSVLSKDGNYVAFSTTAANIVSGDRNDASDVFLFDVSNRLTTRVTLTDAGEELEGSARIRDISADGRYVLYIYEANDQTTVDPWRTGLYVYDRTDQTNKSIRYLDGGYYSASISEDGNFVAFQYRRTNSTALAWVNTRTGASGAIDTTTAGYSTGPRFSPDGKYVTYTSSKTDLVDGVSVSGERHQVYLTELSTGSTVLVSQSADGEAANNYVGSANFIAGGKYLRFTSNASNLHSQDTDGNDDVFLFEMPVQ